MEKISVIVPVYNVERYLRQCLDSIVNQTYQNLEIILVDDGSPDNCGAICDEYAEKDGRIIVIHKENGGVRAARNDGIERATGDWVAFADSDDWCEMDYYEQLIKAVGNHKADVICAGGYCKEYPSKSIQIYTFTEPFQFTGRKSMVPLMKRLRLYGLPWDKLYRTTFLKENHLLFDVTCEAFDDFLFNLQVYDKTESVIGCRMVGYHYRQVATSIANGLNSNKPQISYDSISKFYSYIEQQGLTEELSQALTAVTLTAIAVALNCYYFHPANQKPYAQIAKELKELKTWPYFHEAIYRRSNQYLEKKQIFLKYALQLPWTWPVKILHSANLKLRPN